MRTETIRHRDNEAGRHGNEARRHGNETARGTARYRFHAMNIQRGPMICQLGVNMGMMSSVMPAPVASRR